MTKGLRWRVLVLQVGLIGIFAFAAGMLFWGGSFSQSTIQSQLTAQKITCPAANTPAITSLPAADAAAMTAYAGQQLTTGPQAEVYADHFIKVHLGEVAGGLTYSQVSALAMAQPANTKLAGEVQTLFRGETLRGLLLNAYGWWTVGSVAIYAGIGMTVASAAVLLALLFELYRWRRSSIAERVVAVDTVHTQVGRAA
ncbi:MAG: hypothetical protein JOZ46_10525 [Candidatus Dormibacteraeota bacterium]|nr:hypothetical protein [Candidatus Dormibacteraeota bacterium]MBV9526234.1 hypothetical protein [Candidatus Dormibacteraeota bacterium]